MKIKKKNLILRTLRNIILSVDRGAKITCVPLNPALEYPDSGIEIKFQESLSVNFLVVS